MHIGTYACCRLRSLGAYTSTSHWAPTYYFFVARRSAPPELPLRCAHTDQQVSSSFSNQSKVSITSLSELHQSSLFHLRDVYDNFHRPSRTPPPVPGLSSNPRSLNKNKYTVVSLSQFLQGPRFYLRGLARPSKVLQNNRAGATADPLRPKPRPHPTCNCAPARFSVADQDCSLATLPSLSLTILDIYQVCCVNRRGGHLRSS